MRTQCVAALAALLLVVSAVAAADDLPDGWKDEPFIMGAVNPQKAWVNGIPAPDAWQPEPQPDLADALKNAPRLEIEEAGPPVRVVANTRGHVLVVPNKDGNTWDALFHYYQSYGGEQEVFIVDLGTGERKTVWFNSDRKDGRKEKVSPFGAWYAHGKLFWPQNASAMAWYDPETNEITYKEYGGPVFHGHVRYLADDGNIYFFGAKMGAPGRKGSAFVPAVFNTKTLEMTWHDPVGPDNRGVVIFYPKGIKDGDWLYAAIGKKPWRIHAYNFKTREYRILASADIIGNYKTINFAHVKGGGVQGYIREADFVDGIQDFDRKEFAFWLKDGKIFARTGNTPPWSDKPAEEGSPREHLFRWSNIQYWPADWTPPSDPPCFEQEGAADSDGNVIRRYRWGGKGEWHTLALKVSSYPAATAALAEVNDHVLFGVAAGYAEHTFFDLDAKRVMGAGASGISGYTCGVTGRLFSVCGYPNSITAYYDPTRPLAHDGDAPNPVLVNEFKRYSDTHYPTAGIVGGADGRIYSAGHGAGRTRKGGGWSWYDPATGKVGGQMFDWNVLSMTDVADGRTILLSGGGKLSCWDTTTHTFLYQEALGDLVHPGYITEALPGLVIGFAPRKVGDGVQHVLYGLDPVARKVLWTKEVPAEYKSARVKLYGNPYLFRRGPDGFIWTYLDDILVRIDPRTAHVSPVGRLPVGNVFIAFARGRIYIAGKVGQYRIKDLSVPVVSKP